MSSRDEGGLVPKLVWRVKLVAELEQGTEAGGTSDASF